ncbi:MAG: hypothetical protein JWN78_2600 [Bacteroidota bacterium]|nr:hypothetical protein [Bacteroidota bacterium]
MNSISEKELSGRKLLERITMFNDAVYAIVLTLMVLDLKLPENASCTTVAAMWHSLRELSPKLLAFLLSVVLVGGNWISSVNIQRTQVRADSKYLVFTVIYLSIIALTPFTCHLIGNYPDNPLSYLVFGGVMDLMIINSIFYFRYCRKQNLFHEDANLKEIKKLEKIIIVLGFFVVAIATTSFLSTKLSFCLFLAYNLFPFFITKSLRIYQNRA